MDRRLATNAKSVLDVKEASKKGWSAMIRKHARYQLELQSIPEACVVCSYDTYVECCHLKPICEFPDTALLSDVNSVGNLVFLCPNHHKEFDTGTLTYHEIVAARAFDRVTSIN